MQFKINYHLSQRTEHDKLHTDWITVVPLNFDFKQVLAWAEGCNDSTATVEVVSHCPKTLEEQVKAANRKSCSKFSHKCSSFVYHCVMNVWENETLEVHLYVRQER